MRLKQNMEAVASLPASVNFDVQLEWQRYQRVLQNRRGALAQRRRMISRKALVNQVYRMADWFADPTIAPPTLADAGGGGGGGGGRDAGDDAPDFDGGDAPYGGAGGGGDDADEGGHDGSEDAHGHSDGDVGGGGPGGRRPGGIASEARHRRSPEVIMLRQWFGACLVPHAHYSYDVPQPDGPPETKLIQLLAPERKNIVIRGLPVAEPGAYSVTVQDLSV